MGTEVSTTIGRTLLQLCHRRTCAVLPSAGPVGWPGVQESQCPSACRSDQGAAFGAGRTRGGGGRRHPAASASAAQEGGEMRHLLFQKSVREPALCTGSLLLLGGKELPKAINLEFKFQGLYSHAS